MDSFGQLGWSRFRINFEFTIKRCGDAMGRWNPVRLIVGACVIVASCSPGAHSAILYDGALGTLPDQQGFTYLNLPVGSVTPQVAGGATTLDSFTPGMGPQAGYLRFSPIALDRNAGYRLTFSVEITQAAQSNPERAGFSVIAIGNDVAAGVPSSIEIGFQDNRVFSQNDAPLFGNPAAEESSFDAVGVGFVDYELSVFGSGYELRAGGTPILSGSLKDYTAFAGFPDPYESANFLFFGDNSTSASANVRFRSASITAIPEPSSAALVMLAGLFSMGRRVRNRPSL